MHEFLPQILAKAPYDPAEIVLIGCYINNSTSSRSKGDVKIRVETTERKEGTLTVQLPNFDPSRYQIALISSYVYESQLYELPKPKVMVVTGRPSVLPVDGTANNLPDDIRDPFYEDKMLFWSMNRLDRSVELSVENDLLENLILQANLPGRRSPNSYSANMQLAHRSGRMTS